MIIVGPSCCTICISLFSVFPNFPLKPVVKLLLDTKRKTPISRCKAKSKFIKIKKRKNDFTCVICCQFSQRTWGEDVWEKENCYSLVGECERTREINMSRVGPPPRNWTDLREKESPHPYAILLFPTLHTNQNLYKNLLQKAEGKT